MPKEKCKCFQCQNEKVGREAFMEFFRSDDWHNQMSVDDCVEIWMGCLTGNSDITRESMEELCNNYGVSLDEVIKRIKK